MNIEVHLGNAIRDIKNLENQIHKKGEEIVWLRFYQGCKLNGIVGNTEYGESVVSRIANESGVNESTLRVAYGVAKFFNFNEELLQSKINELKNAGKSIGYNYFRAALQGHKNPEVHGSEEKYKEHLLSKVEDTLTLLNEALEKFPDDEEVKGVTLKVYETLDGFDIIGNRGTSGTKRGGRWQCEEYLRYVREHKCCITGEHPVEAHHLIYKSRGGQASDLFAVPMSSEIHKEYHSLGHKKFVEKYGVDFNAIVTQLIEGFISQLLK